MQSYYARTSCSLGVVYSTRNKKVLSSCLGFLTILKQQAGSQLCSLASHSRATATAICSLRRAQGPVGEIFSCLQQLQMKSQQPSIYLRRKFLHICFHSFLSTVVHLQWFIAFFTVLILNSSLNFSLRPEKYKHGKYMLGELTTWIFCLLRMDGND